jgi:4'-phosphopantetheinyl transferase
MIEWKSPTESSPNEFSAGSVHLWRIPLDRDASATSAPLSLLADDEVRRYERFKPEAVKRRFALARGGMRVILGRYLSSTPGSLEFRYGEQGKPSLAPEQNPAKLRFNLTHSHDLAILAVASDREVGVDVEHLRDNIEFEMLAARYFSPLEAEPLASLEGNELKRQFFRIWTAKEAYIKAIGQGLQIPLDQFDVAVGSEQQPNLLETRHAPEEQDRWSLHSFDCGDDYLGTLAIEKPASSPRFWLA